MSQLDTSLQSKVEVPPCSCGAPATANGRECGLHFRERLASIVVDRSSFDTAERSSTYYDREAVTEMFGENSRERMLDHTDGLGYARSRKGEVLHKNRNSGEVEALTERQIDRTYLGGDTEQDV